ncbi:beta-1,4 N-acetylgalactosaminyltransferase 2-like [Trematomus bernacchii]|uniref:beta-1,4 N-acetylgalactosaminyltransferase 2-like n=1 Tax=Trematomus bernacchii TaxID=40690 RepID=UPI00146D61B1|nr:beta-1,4 N-acetylgalactosaminyltransferase 2-like [Trematomus bernacchii]
MALCTVTKLQTATLGCVLVCVLSYLYLNGIVGGPEANPLPSQHTKRLLARNQLPSKTACTCSPGSAQLKDFLPPDSEELLKRRAKELQQHKARTESVLSTRLYAPSNSPLQYPIQGFKVRPMTPTFIPGLAVHAEQRSNYTVSLEVSEGVLRTTIPAKGVQVKVTGNGESRLMVESSSLEALNELLADVSYNSTIYHIHTGDLASFQFEDHEAVFPITIKQPQPPVLYDMGKDINSQVTIITKTFLRYPELNVLLKTIREFYKDIEIIIADDSMEPEKITGPHIQHFIMPPAKGWFAGRNLAVSQVTTKYFLWVDDDFLFTKLTKIEELVKVMEAVPELDVLGGKVQGDQFYFSLIYEEGDEVEGGCMYRKSRGRYRSLPGYPECSLVSGVVNFFLARTDAVQRVGFDPQLKRVAHSEFFMDGLGSLMVATCGHVSVSHQARLKHKDTKLYQEFRYPPKSDVTSKLQLHFFKNHLKCIKYG